MNQLKLGAILSYVSLGLSNIIGIIYTPFMLRLMGQSEYGLYSLVLTVVSALTLLDFGLGAAVVRYTAEFKAKGETNRLYSMLGMFIILYTIVGVICFFVGLVLANQSYSFFNNSMSSEEIEKAEIMIWMITIYLSISFPLSIFGSIITAYENYVFQKIINILRVILMPCIMIPLLLIGYKSVAMASVTIILGIIALVTNIWFCFYKIKIKISFHNFELNLLKEISSFSMLVFIKMIFDRIYWSSGQFILGSYAGTTAVAIFAISIQIKGYFYAFANAINGVFLPRLTVLVTNNCPIKVISDLFIKIGRIQMQILAYLLSTYILFGQYFIELWAGKNYLSSFYISLIIIIPYTIPLVQALGGTILQAYKKQKYQVNIFFLISLITIGLSLELTTKYKEYGCAIALAVSIILGEILLMNWIYWKKIKLNMPQFWFEIIKICALMSIIAISYYFIFNVEASNFYELILNIIKYTMVYAIITIAIGLNKYEKGILLKGINKISKTSKLYVKKLM